MKYVVLGMILFTLTFAPLLALADNPCTVEGMKASPDKLSTLPRCVNQIYVWSLGVGSLLALLMVIAGGYMKMTSAGNAEQSTKGTEFIWSSIIGLTLLFIAYLLLRTINPDLVKFNLDSMKGLDQTQNAQPADVREGTAQTK